MQGIMIANKNCKDCNGKGYLQIIQHGIKLNQPCGCLRPLPSDAENRAFIAIVTDMTERSDNLIKVLAEAKELIV